MVEDSEESSLWGAAARPRAARTPLNADFGPEETPGDATSGDAIRAAAGPATEATDATTDAADGDTADLRKRMADAQRLLASLAESRDSAAEQGARRKQEAADVEAELDRLRRRAEEDAYEVARLRRRLDEQLLVVEAQQVQISELENHGARIAKLRAQLAGLREQAAQSRIEAARRTEDVSRRDAVVRELREEIAQLQAAASTDELDRLRKREAVLTEGIAQRDRQIAQLRAELVEAELRHGTEVSSIIDQFGSQD